MANKAKTVKPPKTTKKFWLSLQLPIEYKAQFENMAKGESRSVKAQATHILIAAIEHSGQSPAPVTNQVN